jgi:hypothetical protein
MMKNMEEGVSDESKMIYCFFCGMARLMDEE